MMQMTLMRAGTNIRLGQELARGGEGTVFAVDGWKDWSAKIYSSPPDRRKAQKLEVMTGEKSPSLHRIAAWPKDLLIDSAQKPRGFIMPWVDARGAIHELYSPKSRLEVFPKADFQFLGH